MIYFSFFHCALQNVKVKELLKSVYSLHIYLEGNGTIFMGHHVQHL